MKKNLSLILLICFIVSCRNSSQTNSSEPTEINISDVPLINYSVVNLFPHDTTLFTEGLVFHDGKIYEASGAPSEYPYTNSVVGYDDLQTGKFTSKISIDKKIYFGEGIVFLVDKLYQLTYTNQIGFVYDAHSFKKINSFLLPSREGWAFTTDGKYLIMDDSSNHLIYIDPLKLKPVKVLSVTRDHAPQDSLNELEFIKGYIYANIWYRNEIVKIDTSNGKIVGKIDLTSIVNEAKMKHPVADVLNGIAYDSASDKIYVTGKLWQNIYQINFPH